jgi:Tfp pilus assembly protein PilF
MALLGRWFGFGREELFDQALRSFDRGDWDAAIERFEGCLEGADDQMTRLAKFYIGESYAQLGRSMAMRGNFEDAATNLIQAIDISPRYPDLHIALARIYSHLGRVDLREAEIEAALEINPKFVDARFEKGLLLYDRGDHEAGVQTMREAVDSDPGLDSATFQRGIEAHFAGEHARARSFLASAVTSESSEGQIHLSLATSYHRERMFEEAAASYCLACELMPAYADVHCRYGQVLLELGRLPEAVVELRRAIQINPRYVHAHAYLGVAHIKNCQHELAEDELRAALALDPSNQVALSAARRLRAALL